jgi:hypothetical protein
LSQILDSLHGAGRHKFATVICHTEGNKTATTRK